MTIDEYRKLTKNAKPSKYRNVRTNGIDSKGEAARAEELKLMQKAGAISDLKMQPQFTLQESYITPDGERIRAIRYVADFSYRRDGVFVVEDFKSPVTRKRADYRMKCKLMQERYGITVTEVMK